MGPRRFITALSVVALGGRASAATPGVLQIPFTNDAVTTRNQGAVQFGGPAQPTYGEALAQARMGLYGPDGPWQAVAISVGDVATPGPTRNQYSGVWPIIGDFTYLLGPQAGGNYTTAQGAQKDLVSVALYDSFTNETMKYADSDDGQPWPERPDIGVAKSSVGLLSVHQFTGISDYYDSFKFTTNILEVAGWEASLPNGNKYTLKTGHLGMRGVLNSFTGNGCTTACTQEDFKNIGVIGSRTFSLHIGSTMTGQQGSFALGGYEQTRIVGPVGVFDVMPVDNMPIVFLRDLFLGVEAGHSPFRTDRTDNISVFTGVPFGDDRSAKLNTKLRARQGSVVVMPSASSPGIYLPEFLCEGLSRYLPVILDPSTGYYFWNTTSPFYTALESSAGYLGFVVSDRNARNITIKVPFVLLRLNLEPPLVPVPTKVSSPPHPPLPSPHSCLSTY